MAMALSSGQGLGSHRCGIVVQSMVLVVILVGLCGSLQGCGGSEEAADNTSNVSNATNSASNASTAANGTASTTTTTANAPPAPAPTQQTTSLVQRGKKHIATVSIGPGGVTLGPHSPAEQHLGVDGATYEEGAASLMRRSMGPSITINAPDEEDAKNAQDTAKKSKESAGKTYEATSDAASKAKEQAKIAHAKQAQLERTLEDKFKVDQNPPREKVLGLHRDDLASRKGRATEKAASKSSEKTEDNSTEGGGENTTAEGTIKVDGDAASDDAAKDEESNGGGGGGGQTGYRAGVNARKAGNGEGYGGRRDRGKPRGYNDGTEAHWKPHDGGDFDTDGGGGVMARSGPDYKPMKEMMDMVKKNTARSLQNQADQLKLQGLSLQQDRLEKAVFDYRMDHEGDERLGPDQLDGHGATSAQKSAKKSSLGGGRELPAAYRHPVLGPPKGFGEPALAEDSHHSLLARGSSEDSSDSQHDPTAEEESAMLKGTDQEDRDLLLRVKRLEDQMLPFIVNRTSHEVNLRNWNLQVSADKMESGLGNVIVGEDQNVAKASNSLVAGYKNTAEGDSVVISGGYGNLAMGDLSKVTGGHLNDADGMAATVSGGVGNVASEFGASVAGGLDGTAEGREATVAGGEENSADGIQALQFGGNGNRAKNQLVTTGGGYNNSGTGPFGIILGGYGSDAAGNGVSIFGGAQSSSEKAGEAVLGRSEKSSPALGLDCENRCDKELKEKDVCGAVRAQNPLFMIKLSIRAQCRPCMLVHVQKNCKKDYLPPSYKAPTASECAKCLTTFEEGGGCRAWRLKDWEKLTMLAPKDGDPCYPCTGYAENHCKDASEDADAEKPTPQSQEEICDSCLLEFEERGGCKAWRSQDWPELTRLTPKENTPCYACEYSAEQKCHIPNELRGSTYKKATVDFKSQAQCKSCLQDFESQGGCKAWKAKDWAKLRLLAPHPGSPCYTCEKHAEEQCDLPVDLRSKAGGRAVQAGNKPATNVPQKLVTGRKAGPKTEEDCAVCVKDFAAQGGCKAWHRGDWDRLKNMRMLQQGQPCDGCKSVAESHCQIPKDHAKSIKNSALNCGECAEEFDAKGGCEAWRKQDWKAVDAVKAADDSPCSACTTFAEEHCHGRGTGVISASDKSDVECKDCTLDFAKNGGCEAFASGNTYKIQKLVPPTSNCARCRSIAEQHCNTGVGGSLSSYGFPVSSGASLGKDLRVQGAGVQGAAPDASSDKLSKQLHAAHSAQRDAEQMAARVERGFQDAATAEDRAERAADGDLFKVRDFASSVDKAEELAHHVAEQASEDGHSLSRIRDEERKLEQQRHLHDSGFVTNVRRWGPTIESVRHHWGHGPLQSALELGE